MAPPLPAATARAAVANPAANSGAVEAVIDSVLSPPFSVLSRRSPRSVVNRQRSSVAQLTPVIVASAGLACHVWPASPERSSVPGPKA